MRDERANVRCSACGQEGRREDFFGAEPELLCERCAHGVRQRMAPAPPGRLENLLKHKPVVTVFVLGAAIVLFLLTRMGRGQGAVSDLLGMARTIVDPSTGRAYWDMARSVTQEPWRLLTSAFLHGGIFHILFNAWWIWDLGRGIEYRRGPLAMAALVLGSAVASGALQWVFGGPGIGLSGVVYGLAAFLFAQRRQDPLAAAVMNPATTRLLVAWLVIGVILSEMNIFPIGNWAHGGGAVWGLLAGFAWQGRYRWVWTGLVALLTLGMAVAVTMVAPRW